jgi:hypothetical protein
MKMAVFWNVAPCSLLGIDRRFRGANCFHHQGVDGGITSSEISVNFYQTARRNIPQHRHLHLQLDLCDGFISNQLGYKLHKQDVFYEKDDFCILPNILKIFM